jgi:hypothetical protein
MRRVRLLIAPIVAVLAVLGAGAHAPASAQGSDAWSWVVTPQIWAAHIEKNGFASPGGLGGFFVFQGANVVDANPFEVRDSEPLDAIYPQWGLQVAAQKDRWTLAGSFQYVSFETRNDVVYKAPVDVLIPVPRFFGFDLVPLTAGDRTAQEFISTTRIDIDLAASYVFPDVVENRLDLSIGGGVKVIYAEANRQYSRLSNAGRALTELFGPGLYIICKEDDCSDARSSQRVGTTDVLYGATIPMSATVHLTSDAKWLLPMSISPFLGAETRDDRDVVYKLKGTTVNDIRVDRLDGTTFAYGVTADMTVRYLLSDTVSIYGGGRVQYINGHEEYLAYGPIMGMSVRFGGR